VILALLGRQLRHMRWILAGLGVGLFLLEGIIIQLAKAFEGGPGIEQILDMLPDMILDLVKAQIPAFTFPAFAAFGFMHPGALVASSAVIVMFATAPAGERDSGLLDLLLSRPVTRTKHLLASLLGVLLTATTMPLCLLAGCATGLALVEVPGELPWTAYVPAAALLACLLAAVGGFSLLVGATARRRGTAVARIAAVLLVTYVADTLTKVFGALAPLRWATPFHWFDPISTTLDGRAPWGEAAVLLGAAAVPTALAFRCWRTRDL